LELSTHPPAPLVEGKIHGPGSADNSDHDRQAITAASWTLELTIRSASERNRHVLKAPNCQALADATALLVAVSIDPLSVIRRLAIAFR